MTVTYNPVTGEWEGQTGGVDLQELASRTPKADYAKLQKVQKTADEIVAENMQTPEYALCYKGTQFLAEQYNLKVHAIFRNKAKDDATYNPKTGHHTIRYSYTSVEDIATKGMREYPTVGPVWLNQGIKLNYKRGYSHNLYRSEAKGHEAIWMMVVHEFAHVLQQEAGGVWHGSIHNEIFKEKLEELIVLFPWNEVKGQLN